MPMASHIVRAHLLRNGKTFSSLATELKVQPNMVSQVVSGRTTSLRVAKAVAAAAGLEVRQIWPGVYDRLLEMDAVLQAA